MNRPEIVVAGHVCLDLIPEAEHAFTADPGSLTAVGPLRMRVGGCVGNTGLALAGLGIRTEAIGTIGDDALGEIVARDLTAGGVGTAGLRRLAGAGTSYSVVLEAPGQDRAFLHHTGANDRFTADDLASPGASIVHVGYPSLLPALLADGGRALAAALRAIRDTGTTVSLDLAVVDPQSPIAGLDWRSLLARVLAEVDVVTPSWDDLRSVLDPGAAWSEAAVRSRAEDLLGFGAAVVVLSAGEHGTVLASADGARLAEGGAALAPLASTWSDQRLAATPRPVEVIVSTTGAGDASTAGILAGLVRRESPRHALALADDAARAALAGRRPERARDGSVPTLGPEVVDW